MFSITTMASSTTKPVEMVSAMRERLSRLYPHKYITAKVPTSDTGTATLGMTVARTLRRKMKTTRTTRITEMIKERSTSFRLARMVVVRSNTLVISIPDAIEALRDGIAFLMRSTVSMMLAPGCRKMMMVTEGLPSM